MPGPTRVCIGPVGPATDLSSEEKRKQSVQAVWRGFFNRWEGPAAETIQRWWRGHVARRYVRALREGRLLRSGPTQHVRDTAAVVIQRHWRGHAARQLAADHRKAVLDIQRWWKGYRARKDWPRLRLRWRVLNHYATDIQRWVRGHLARLRYARELARRRTEAEGGAVAPPDPGRAAREDGRREAAAVVVQAHWRGYQARKRRAWLQREAAKRERFERRQRAATGIQAAYRGWCVRRAIAARRQAEGGPLAPGSLAGAAVAAPRIAGSDDGIVVPYGSYDDEDGEDGGLLYGRPAPHGHPEPPPLRVAAVVGPGGAAGVAAKGSGRDGPGKGEERGAAGGGRGRAAAAAVRTGTRKAGLCNSVKKSAAGSGLASVRAARAGKAAADGGAAVVLVAAAEFDGAGCGGVKQHAAGQEQEREGEAGGQEAGQVTHGSPGAVPVPVPVPVTAAAGTAGTTGTAGTAGTAVLVPVPPGTPPPPGALGSRARPSAQAGQELVGPPSSCSQQQPQPLQLQSSPGGQGAPRAAAGQQESAGGARVGGSSGGAAEVAVASSTAPPPVAGPHLLRKSQSLGAAASRTSGGASAPSATPSSTAGPATASAKGSTTSNSSSSSSRRATMSEGLAPADSNHNRAQRTFTRTATAAAPLLEPGPGAGRPPSRQRALVRASNSLSQSTSGGGGLSRAPSHMPPTPRQGVRPGQGAGGAQGLGALNCDQPGREGSRPAGPARCDPLRMSAPELPAHMRSSSLRGGSTIQRRSSGQQGAVLGGPVRTSADGGGGGGRGLQSALRAQQPAQGLRRQAWGPADLVQSRTEARAGTGSGIGAGAGAVGARAGSAARSMTRGGSTEGRGPLSWQGQAGTLLRTAAAGTTCVGPKGGVRAGGTKGVGVGQCQDKGALGPQGNPLHKQVMRANRGGVVVAEGVQGAGPGVTASRVLVGQVRS